MNKIKFFNNYNNKLNCDYFTTIRAYNTDKALYYRNSINSEYQVLLNNKNYNKAVLLASKVMPYSDVSAHLLVLDTGIPSLKKIWQMFNRLGLKDMDDLIILLLFERVKSKYD